MKFTKYKFEEIKPSIRAKWFNLLMDFQNSGIKFAKLEDWKHQTAESCQSTIIASCKYYKITHIKAVIRRGEIFLVNTAISEG